ARRWAWFESVTLPGLVGQSDPDYRVVVMTGPDLPQPWLGRLHEIAAAHPQIAVELVPPMPHHRAACARALRPHVEAAADWVGQFKQDDDDAVALDFVARARRDLRLLMPMLKRDGRGYCDYMKG
ncbi:glycosyltransferase, partial [Leclercia adecarboxylata]|uniref:glycosyltransferase n=1 Tax=Leclercia adecarboxylata TaxID=83655 RepID=UPI00234DACE9